ncbi:ExbD/TolR family protein [Luteibaculum oceani]|uniref:Biopolymer transporter ExbD n=1 Tax=Luteibaculum oceani TaxID=1294296 RepID=A0A5C6V0C1_9FLAO|nr:biopolymer transporter ExbD [Luteibaculum oceani]TXC78957.1 biopolymer transporter ExbD [Luteibaculum oceani]
MAKFKKQGSKSQPAISTASLPDIVFMLLFFFMVTTVMREVELKVKVDKPQASEIERLENKALVDYIYIGPPTDKRYGTEPKIQLNDVFAEVSDIGTFIEDNRSQRDEQEVPLITTSLKVDKQTKMKIVTDVKQALRKVQALKLNYSTHERARTK